MGKEGLAIAVTASAAMAIAAYFAHIFPIPADASGICFPSPDLWNLRPFWGWALNTSLLFLICVAFYGLNKEFSIIKGSDTVQLGMFLVMAASNPLITGGLTSSTGVALVNIFCLWILFGCYRQTNSTKELFAIGTLLSIGSMFEYSLLLISPFYVIGSIMLKCFNFKIVPAFLMGITAPYWVCLGFGITTFENLRFPDFHHLFEGYASDADIFVATLNIGVTVTIGLLLSLSNAVRLYAGNSRRRLLNMVINLIGGACVILMIFDYGNMTSYLATVYLVSAIQIGNLFELSTVHGAKWWLYGISALYAGSFIIMI